MTTLFHTGTAVAAPHLEGGLVRVDHGLEWELLSRSPAGRPRRRR